MEGQLNNNQDLIHPPPLCQVMCNNVTVKREVQTLHTSEISYLSDTNSVDQRYKTVNEVTTVSVQGTPVDLVTKCPVPKVNLETKQPDGSTDMNVKCSQIEASPDLNIKGEPCEYYESHGIKSRRFKTENIIHDANQNVHKDCQIEILSVYTISSSAEESPLSSQPRAGCDDDSLHGAIKDNLSSSREDQVDSTQIKSATKPLLTTVQDDIVLQSGIGLIPVSVVTLRKQDQDKATAVPAERHPKTPPWKATPACVSNNNETSIDVAQTLESEYSPSVSHVVKPNSQYSKLRSLVHNGRTDALSCQQKRLSCVPGTETKQDLSLRYEKPTLIGEQDLLQRSCGKDVRISLYRIKYPVKSETQKLNSNISKLKKVAETPVSCTSKQRTKNVRSRKFDTNAKTRSKNVKSLKLETNAELTNKTKSERLNQPMKIREINSEDVLTTVSPLPPGGNIIKQESKCTNMENYHNIQKHYRRHKKSYPGMVSTDEIRSRGNVNSLCSEKAKKIRKIETKGIKKEPSNKKDRRYQCNICQKEFKQSGHMKRHLASHDENKPFQCKICNAAFKRRDTLNVHMRAHTGDARYACRDCGKKFMTSDRLLRHTRIHTGEKLYACKMCSKRFTQNGDLVKHMATHSKVKKFPCSICSRSYSQHFVLKRHMRESHSEKKFQCYTCHKKFTRLTTLRDHMKLHEVKRKKPGVNQLVIKEENMNSSEIIVKKESKSK